MDNLFFDDIYLLEDITTTKEYHWSIDVGDFSTYADYTHLGPFVDMSSLKNKYPEFLL